MEGSGWLFRGSWGLLNARLSWARGDKHVPEVCVFQWEWSEKEAEETVVFPPSAAFPKSV